MKPLLFISLFFLFSCSSKSWKEASRESAGLAPKVDELNESIVQIYYARAFSWRGIFGVHPWISWKRTQDKEYTVAQVISWNLRRNGSSLSVMQDIPDRKWYDSQPTLMFEIRGKKADKAISQIEKLIENYPFKDKYILWPGPNSNTFVSYIIRNTDELTAELPASAIGKDYLGPTTFFASSPSGTGFQFSILGALGLTLGADEGIEINILGLSFGLDFWTPALKLPLAGRVGFPHQSSN